MRLLEVNGGFGDIIIGLLMLPVQFTIFNVITADIPPLGWILSPMTKYLYL